MLQCLATKKQVLKFLGLIDYYKTFMRNFAAWHNHFVMHYTILNTTMEMIIEAFILETDPSGIRRASMPMQYFDGHKAIIAATSQTLSKVENN